ncbi:MAG: DHH family phosphoesterase, partial [Eubacteriales bacterium]
MHIKNTFNTVWNIGTPDEAVVRQLAETLNVSPFLAKLLAAKKMTAPVEAERFLNGGTELLHDPFLLPDMDKAVERIRKALAEHEKILIYGDYDVDGVTSVSVLLLYLREHGADVCYYIPERISEG